MSHRSFEGSTVSANSWVVTPTVMGVTTPFTNSTMLSAVCSMLLNASGGWFGFPAGYLWHKRNDDPSQHHTTSGNDSQENGRVRVDMSSLAQQLLSFAIHGTHRHNPVQ